MLYTIIGVIAIIFAIGILIEIGKFVYKHIGTFILIGIVATFVYYVTKSGDPLGVLSSWYFSAKNIIFTFLNGNTIFNSIAIYAILIITTKLIANMLISFRVKRVFIRIISVTLTVTVLGLAISFIDVNMDSTIVILLVAISCLVLGQTYLYTRKNIGEVNDVKRNRNILNNYHIQILILSLFNLTKFPVSNLNEIFNTSVNNSIVYFITIGIYVVFEIHESLKIKSPFKSLVKHVKNNYIILDNLAFDSLPVLNLQREVEYYKACISKLIDKKKIYQSPFDKNMYFNKSMYKFFEKGINANKSSEELERSLSNKLNDYSFEEVYRWMYIIFKDHDISFKRSQETEIQRSNYGEINDVEFVLMRYPIEEHPILKESDKIKSSYIGALNWIVSNSEIKETLWTSKLEEFLEEFNVETFKNSHNSISVFSKPIRRKIGLFRNIKNDYRYLLLLESLYFNHLVSEKELKFQTIEKLANDLNIHKSHRDFIYKYIRHMYIDGNIERAEEVLQTSFNHKILESLKLVHRNIMWNEKYITLEQYNVAVCATMSAGKSTFINALLGTDYIPSKNEACTAKITTIRDNDLINRTIGYYTRNDDTKVYSNTITNQVLDDWNSDPLVKHTIIESDIDGVKCDNGILVVHDTPGTNNSGDLNHHRITVDFLNKTETDLVMFLINAEHVSATDSENLIKEIKGILEKREGRMVFLLNKIDSFDEESGDNLEVTMNEIELQLQNYGFERPILIPISAYAGRLFKMALKGEELTKRERRDFRNLYEYFEEDYEMSFGNLQLDEVIKSEYLVKGLEQDVSILVGDDEYTHNQVINVLNKTGIPVVEYWFNKQINNEVLKGGLEI